MKDMKAAGWLDDSKLVLERIEEKVAVEVKPDFEKGDWTPTHMRPIQGGVTVYGDITERISKPLAAPVDGWLSGKPPLDGAYEIRKDGYAPYESMKKIGDKLYSYWNGEHWTFNGHNHKNLSCEGYSEEQDYLYRLASAA